MQIGAAQTQNQMRQKFSFCTSSRSSHLLLYIPFFLVEFWFVATFSVYNIDLSIFILDSIQSAKEQSTIHMK